VSGIHPWDSLQLRREMKAAEALEERWAVLVEHEHGLEVHGAGALALEIGDRVEAAGRSWWLLREEPVSCWVASGAGLNLLKQCPRCSPR
jgi:hypothetical protein